MWRDLVHSLRILRRYPFSSIAIVVVLALGIGANTAMFESFHAWITRPLDFTDPERLVAPYSMRPNAGERRHMVSARDVADWRRESKSFAAIALFNRKSFVLDDEVDRERIQGASVEAGLFPLLGVEPVSGRGFSTDEDLPGQPAAVALISESLWRERFDGDPAAIGKELRLDGKPHRIVGIMKRGFGFPEWGEVWTPLGADPDAAPRDQRIHDSVARLAPGVTREQANEELAAIAERLAELHPETNRGWSIELLPLREKWLPPVVRIALTATQGAAFFALLVICANVAGLLLAQANARAREMALRSALGAGRGRLVRQTITECTVLAVVAGVLGIPVAILFNRWMMSWVPTKPPYLFATEVDRTALVFTGVVTIAAGIACALAPVLRNASAAVWETLGAGARTGAGPRSRRMGALLVVGELALSTALGIGTLLLAKSFIAERLADHGYRVEDVVSMRLDLDASAYEEPAQRVAFVERALEHIETMPNVESAGATNRLPAGQGFTEARLEVEGLAIEAGQEPVVAAQWVTPGYFEALAIPQLDGRDFTAAEVHDGADVAVISASLAERLWPGESALGRQVRRVVSADTAATAPWLLVIGTVGDIEPVENMINADLPVRQTLYRPWGAAAATSLLVVIHSQTRDVQLVDAVRDSLRTIDPGVRVDEVLTMADAVDRDQWVSRVFSQLLGLYAAVAVAIALVGVYGLVADSVSRRTHEIAVRMALGARRRQVVGLVMRHALKLGAAGIAIGLALAFALTRFGSAMIPGMSARDPAVFGGVALLVAVVTLLAIWLPARSIVRIEPGKALRSE